jgi:hypothetical protein
MHFKKCYFEIVLRRRGFRFAIDYFHGEIIAKMLKYTVKLKTKSPEPLGQFQPFLAQIILRGREFRFVHIDHRA